MYVWKDAFNWTKDVPENYLRELGQIWTLQQTEYIDGVAALYTTKGTRFDGVFTKLSATWSQWGKLEQLEVETLKARSMWNSLKVKKECKNDENQNQ